METITIWAEMSDKATNAQRITAPDTHVLNAILDIDAAKIRKNAEIVIAKDQKIREQRVYHGSGAHALLSELRQVEQRDVIMAEAQSIRMRCKKQKCSTMIREMV